MRLAGLLLVFGLSWVQAADSPSKTAARKAILDPREAGLDYEIQGEYTGQLPGSARYGVQVIALGKGSFRAVGYPGGLPGDGWNGSARTMADGSLSEGVARFKTKQGNGEVSSGRMRLFDDSGSSQGELAKVDRSSPTLGARPPEGAIVLFDGKNADAWRGGRIRDGLLQVGGQTNQAFGDCTLHVEFQTPFMPGSRGQDRGNSGLYLQRRYEVQILDSFGLEGADNECGAIYHHSKPAVNMCFPPLAWQTFDVDFTMARFDGSGQKTANARITVKQNGVLVQDNLELTTTSDNPWRTKETPQPGPFYFQYHGSPVQFRNIWIVPR